MLDENSLIVTNPKITAFDTKTGGAITTQGRLYNGPSSPSGLFPAFAFGSDRIPANPVFATQLEEASTPWAVFNFDSLLINGTPTFSVPEASEELPNPSTNVILASRNSINLIPPPPWEPLRSGCEIKRAQ